MVRKLPSSKRRGSPRPPRASAEVPDFPSGFEIAGAHKPPRPEYVARDVADFKRRFDAVGGYEPVLRALEYITVARLQRCQWCRENVIVDLPPPNPEDGVLLPWWVVDALGGAVQVARREKRSLDEVMGISGKGGSRTLWQKFDDHATKAVRAVEVRHLIEQNALTLDAASEAVAARHRVTPDIVRANYREIFPTNRPRARPKRASNGAS